MGEVVVSSEDGNMELGIFKGNQVEATERKTNNNKKNNDDSTSVSPLVTAAAPVAADACSSVVRWERFLPKMVLRVLLVEADDSTRQIIAALLRKCSYKVVAIPDGLKAWEVLKGRPHNIDLILTEVDLPSISGFALLTLIMEHEVCKSIPVIMMSSQDSVSTVYKCMLRGAADFLVKPVRKNELRNLWQHVWRRQASSSVGLGPPDESVAQQKDEATAENNAISNYSSDYIACIQRNRECIEKGTDAQSSCTKPELDAEGPDNECVQDLSSSKRSKPSLCDTDVHKHVECNTTDERDLVCNKDDGLRETSAIHDMRTSYGEDLTSNNHFRQFLSIGQACESNGVLMKPSKEAIDLIGAFDNYLKGSNKSTDSYTGVDKVESSPLLDLSLKRSHPSGSVNQVTEDRHGLIHSDASAFSRYVNKTIPARHPTSPSTCNQQNDHRIDSHKQWPNHTVNCNSETHEQMIISPKDIQFPTDQHGEAEIQFSNHKQRLLPAPIPVRGVRFQNLSHANGSFISPVICAHSSSSPMPSPCSVNHQEASYQVNSFHSLNHQTGDSPQFRDSRNQNANDATDNSENKEVHKLESAEERGHLSSPTDRSANSSFCNGNLTHLREGNNGRIDTVPYMSSECENEEALRIRDGNTLRSVQREAALTKFRLKRKERCFEKKVRYESRKKLAEKRPRVKGQFVRQVQNETPLANSCAN